MVSHYWGEPGVDFAGIENAADFIGDYLATWGRITVLDTKEKYGTARVYCHFGWYGIHSIVFPKLPIIAYFKWLWIVDGWPLTQAVMEQLNKAAVPWQRKIYRQAYKKAIAKWPHLVLEILDGADYPELLIGLDEHYDDYFRHVRAKAEAVEHNQEGLV